MKQKKKNNVKLNKENIFMTDLGRSLQQRSIFFLLPVSIVKNPEMFQTQAGFIPCPPAA